MFFVIPSPFDFAQDRLRRGPKAHANGPLAPLITVTAINVAIPWRCQLVRLRDVSTALDMTSALDGAGFSKHLVGAVFVDCFQTARGNANANKLL